MSLLLHPHTVRDFGKIRPVSVPYPQPVRAKVDHVMNVWKKFCASDLVSKNLFVFREEQGIADGGYEFRAPDSEHLIDGKETFHFAKIEVERLCNCCPDDFPEGKGLLEAFEDLEEAIFPFIVDFADHLAGEYVSLPHDFVDKISKSRKYWTFRLLHYLPGTSNIIGVPHCDKGNFTPHLRESAEGLEYLTEGLEWKPVEMDDNSTAILPGMQMQCVSKGYVKALCHRVVSTKETRRVGRYSFVCFVDGKGMPIYDKKRVGRSQLFQPGYNYRMADQEFRELFVL